jgi:hypothetical protein
MIDNPEHEVLSLAAATAELVPCDEARAGGVRRVDSSLDFLSSRRILPGRARIDVDVATEHFGPGLCRAILEVTGTGAGGMPVILHLPLELAEVPGTVTISSSDPAQAAQVRRYVRALAILDRDEPGAIVTEAEMAWLDEQGLLAPR